MPEADQQLARDKAKLDHDKNYQNAVNNQKFDGYNEFLSNLDGYREITKNGLQNQNKDDQRAVEKVKPIMKRAHPLLGDKERYLKMKKAVKGTNKDTVAGLNLAAATEWAMSSAIIDGASPEFTDLVDGMKKYCLVADEVYSIIADLEKQLDTADIDQRNQIENKISFQKIRRLKGAHELIYRAEKYHDKNPGHRFTEVGKTRQMLAKSIPQILSGHISKRQRITKAPNVTVYSEELRLSLRQWGSSVAYCMGKSLNHDKTGLKIYKKFNEIDDLNVERTEYFSFCGMETMNWYQKINECEKFEKALYDQIDLKNLNEQDISRSRNSMFKILDERLKDLLAFTVTDDFFNEEWILLHPEAIIKFWLMANRCSTVFSKSSTVMPKNVTDYLIRLENKDSGLYKKVMEKAEIVTNLAFIYSYYIQNTFGIVPNEVFAHAFAGDFVSQKEYFQPPDMDALDDKDVAMQLKINNKDKLIDYYMKTTCLQNKKDENGRTMKDEEGNTIQEPKYSEDYVRKVIGTEIKTNYKKFIVASGL